MIEKKIEEINSLKDQVSALSVNKDWDDTFLEKVKVDFTYFETVKFPVLMLMAYGGELSQ